MGKSTEVVSKSKHAKPLNKTAPEKTKQESADKTGNKKTQEKPAFSIMGDFRGKGIHTSYYQIEQ